MTVASIDRILDDLYRLDPELKHHDEVLRPLIAKLIHTKPDMAVNEAFVENLRRELLGHDTSPRSSFIQQLFSFFPMKLSYSLGGAAVAFVLVVGLAAAGILPMAPSKSVPKQTLFAAAIRPVGAGAFGSLAANSIDHAAPPVSSGAAASFNQERTAETSLIAVGRGGGGMDATSKMIMRPEWNISYVYTGEELETLPTTMPVYRRTVNTQAARTLGSTLVQFPNGLLSLGKFKNPEVRSFDIVTSDGSGYVVSMDVAHGIISLYKNIGIAMPVDMTQPLRVSDIPSDDIIIEIANAALRDLSIDTSQYGTPRVDNAWRVYYEQTTDKATAWVPDTLTVVYPFMIDGKNAKDMNGNPYGLQVNVNVRTREMAGFWNLASQEYEKSEYQIEQNNNRIMDIVKRGGVYGYPGIMATDDTGIKKMDVEVGTPTIELVRENLWNGQDNLEIYVPAYIFPVVNPPKDYFGSRTIVVPLPKEILDNYNNNGGPIMYMKGMESGDAASVSVPTPVAR